MNTVRITNRIAAALNGAAVAAALLRWPIAPVVLIALSNLLLIWSIERVRSAPPEEPVA